MYPQDSGTKLDKHPNLSYAFQVSKIPLMCFSLHLTPDLFLPLTTFTSVSPYASVLIAPKASLSGFKYHREIWQNGSGSKLGC